jgi:hypothetical protein
VAASGRGLGRRSLGRETRRLLLLVGGVLVALGLIAWLLVRPDPVSHTSKPSPVVRPPAVARIDAGGMTVLKPAVAAGAFWSIVEDQPLVRRLVRIDGRALRPERINLPVQPQAVAAGFGSIWVGGCTHGLLNGPCSQGVVLKLDARGKVLARIPVEGQALTMAAGEGAVWVATWNRSSSWLYRIDPDSDQVAWRVSLNHLMPRFPCCVADLAAGEGKVWLLFGVLGPLVTVDPLTREVPGGCPSTASRWPSERAPCG